MNEVKMGWESSSDGLEEIRIITTYRKVSQEDQESEMPTS
jgi:hypothetical protein